MMTLRQKGRFIELLAALDDLDQAAINYASATTHGDRKKARQELRNRAILLAESCELRISSAD